MIFIPLSSVPAQSFQITLDEQDCEIELITRGENERLYMNLTVDGNTVQNGAVCLNKVSIIQVPNDLFTGSLVFVDTLGDEPPHWSGIDERYQLVFISSSEGEVGNGNPYEADD